jgi:hypothetical protein
VLRGARRTTAHEPQRRDVGTRPTQQRQGHSKRMLSMLALPALAWRLESLSPYQRPAILQPARLYTDVAAKLIKLAFEQRGGCIAVDGIDTVVQPSRGRGDGLFAERDFLAGEIVARYSGIFTSYESFYDAYTSGITSGDYIAFADAQGDRIIDAEPSVVGPCDVGRMVNHSKRKENCYIWSVSIRGVPTGVAFIVTNKPVKAGNEFFLNYGDQYWDDQFNDRFDPLGRLVVDYL